MEKRINLLARCAEELLALDVGEIRLYEMLKKHTTWRIGGPAELMVLPKHIEQIQRVLQYANENQLPVHIIGGGSNLLIDDNGLQGIVIKLAGALKGMLIEDDMVTVEAGYPLPAFANQMAKHQLTGLEFAAGIPGTVGGAVVMNAGAHGQQMSNVVKQITYCDLNGQVKTADSDAAKFTYRGSLFKNSPDYILLSVQCQLNKGDQKQIKEHMSCYLAERKVKQPVELPSAGSVFKNPSGHYAGQLIEAIGGKGWRIGDAQVSPKHGNFIVNLGHATSKDVLALIEKIKYTVQKEYQIVLEEEIHYLNN